uniref:VWFA domain-containing protein n=1 Tax=Panagrellus redivivus TaxID=6233 RepID=A0A7E4VHP6_PANRE
MNIYLLFVVLLPATAASVQNNINCDLRPTPIYTKCQVDLTIAFDVSSAMGNFDNVDTLIRSVQNLTYLYAYGENDTVLSLMEFGIDTASHSIVGSVNYSSVCRSLEWLQNYAHSTGMRNVELNDVFNAYFYSNYVFHLDRRDYQNVLIILTAIDDETQVNNAWNYSKILRDKHHVQIITVAVAKTTLGYLPNLSDQSFSSPSYELAWELINTIANTSCINSGVTYSTASPATVVPTTITTPGAILTTANNPPTPTPYPPTLPTTTTYNPSTPKPSSPYVNGSDGSICATNHKQAWLDLVFVIEHSRVTFDQWNAISSSVLSTISQLTLSNTLESSHTSRVAVITYDLTGTKLQFNFTTAQTIRNILVALNKGKPPPNLSADADIAGGLKAAADYLYKNPSFRAPGVVLYAATYDDSGTNDPITAAEELKADLVKIVAVSFDAANGVNTAKIGELASPGLSLNTHSELSQFGWAVSQLNCRCAHGWTQLIVNNVSYADCFFYQDVMALQAFALCENTDTDFLALASTPARIDLISQLVSKEKPTDKISIGLLRSDGKSAWTWQNAYPYYGYPAFAQELSDTDVYGYLSKSSGNTWQLLADDGMTTGRFYVCQRRSGDTDNIVDL